jgi:hypothetical protein
VRARRVYARWPKPARFDRNLVVIGAGSAGLVTAYIAAAVKAKVTLIEKHRMGGDCLNTGCVPSKALIRSAKFLSHVARAGEFGCRAAPADFDFAEVMERVSARGAHGRAARFGRTLHGLGVDCLEGAAKHRLALGRGGDPRRRRHPDADHPQHRHRSRRAALRAADSRHRGDRLSDLGHVWVLRELPRPAGGARRRADRLRTDAGLRAPRREGDPGGDAAADHDGARTRTCRTGDAVSAPKASPC